MTDRALSRVLGYAQAPAPRLGLIPCVVTRSDVSGVFVAPVGGDARTPRGPCRGRTATALGQLAVGTLVLLADTSQGPWIVVYDGEV